MDTRKLRIVKPPLPAIGVCEGCNSQFKSNKRSEDEVEAEIRAAFDAHKCELTDDNQNTQRFVRDFTEDK
jgi:NMD protein affecting ribosome stability and mRNA decay